MRYNFRTQNGFSLVELAISVTIIGVLIAGVVKGQDILQNARIVTTISAVDSFSKAHRSFYDIYAGLPGDLVTAQADLIGCGSGNANNCAAGNGDGLVGTTLPNSGVYMGADVSGNTENVMYWKHLALAGLLDKVEGSAGTAADDFEAGVTHPVTIPSSVWTIAHVNDQGENVNMAGHIYRLHRSPTGQIANGATASNAHVLQPLYAKALDNKADDGGPNTGNIRAEYSGTLCDEPTSGQNDYNIAVTTKACWMIFLVTE